MFISIGLALNRRCTVVTVMGRAQEIVWKCGKSMEFFPISNFRARGRGGPSSNQDCGPTRAVHSQQSVGSLGVPILSYQQKVKWGTMVTLVLFQDLSSSCPLSNFFAILNKNLYKLEIFVIFVQFCWIPGQFTPVSPTCHCGRISVRRKRHRICMGMSSPWGPQVLTGWRQLGELARKITKKLYLNNFVIFVQFLLPYLWETISFLRSLHELMWESSGFIHLLWLMKNVLE